MAGVNGTNYASTLAVTDTINELTVSGVNKIDNTGMYQEGLYNLLNSIVTNFNAMNAKLDTDTGVTDTNYAATCNMSTLASRGITSTGIHQADLVAALADIPVKFALVTAKLDADGGVEDTDYAATLDFTMDSVAITGTGIKSIGDIVSFLQTVITQFNALLAKLDADESA